MDCEEVKEHLQAYPVSPALSTWANSSDWEIAEQTMQDSEPTVDRKAKRQKPRASQAEPKEQSMLSFWLGKFKKYYTRRRGSEDPVPWMLQDFLNDKERKPTVKKEAKWFQDLDFFTAVNTWFNREGGKGEVDRGKVQESWKSKYISYFEELLKDYEDHHSSMESQKRDSKGSLDSQHRDSGSYLLAVKS